MKRGAIASAMVLAGAALAGCSSEYGYDRVGYAGYAAYGYDDGYHGGGYYPGYAGYYDWFGGYYYPGSGFYVYDRYRRPYRWNGEQQRYWQGRLSASRGPRGGPEWRGFAGGQGRGSVEGGVGLPAYGNRYRGEYQPQAAPAFAPNQGTQALRQQAASGSRAPRGIPGRSARSMGRYTQR